MWRNLGVVVIQQAVVGGGVVILAQIKSYYVHTILIILCGPSNHRLCLGHVQI